MQYLTSTCLFSLSPDGMCARFDSSLSSSRRRREGIDLPRRDRSHARRVFNVLRDTLQRERDTPWSQLTLAAHHVHPLLPIRSQTDRVVQPIHSKKLKDIIHHLYPSIGYTFYLFFHTVRLGCSKAQEASTLRFPFRR
jgi:hypothetical protein